MQPAQKIIHVIAGKARSMPSPRRLRWGGRVTESASTDDRSGFLRLKLCWAIFVFWAVCLVASAIWPVIGKVGLAGLPLPLILAIHGSILYGWKGIGSFVVIGLIVGFVLEASSVATGFPFGSYVHNVPGFKPAGVPVMALMGYTLIGWFAWTIGKLIALNQPYAAQPWSWITVPLAAAFILGGFDLPFDPIGATVQGNWTYRFPSGQFGVPLTNFLGWILTGWTLFQLFALAERRFTPTAAAKARSFWLLPCLLWLAMALQFPLQWMGAKAGIVSVGERTFITADVYEAAVITSLFTIVGVAVFALIRLTALGRDGE